MSVRLDDRRVVLVRVRTSTPLRTDARVKLEITQHAWPPRVTYRYVGYDVSPQANE